MLRTELGAKLFTQCVQGAVGDGLMVEGMPLVDFSVSHSTDHELQNARHGTDLHPHPETFVNIDHLHRGLGTASCGPEPEPQFRIPVQDYAFDFLLCPFSKGENLTALARRLRAEI